jgi:hypothetical protein
MEPKITISSSQKSFESAAGKMSSQSSDEKLCDDSSIKSSYQSDESLSSQSKAPPKKGRFIIKTLPKKVSRDRKACTFFSC